MALNQPQLDKQGIYEANAALPSLLSDLEEVTRIGEERAAQRRRKKRVGGYIILTGFIGAVAGAATGLPWLAALSVLAILGTIGWYIYSAIRGFRLLSLGRISIAKERLATVQQDAGTQTPFSLRLALVAKPKRLSEEAWTGRKNGKQRFFEDCWFSLEGRLLDGTVITDEITDLKRERTFSNPRGKRKTKSRITFLVNVRFSYPNEIYGDARAAGQALNGQVKVGPSATVRSVRVTEKAILLKALVASERDIARTVGMLSLGGYRILNLARRIVAGQRGNTK